jgi:hypothetical protein
MIILDTNVLSSLMREPADKVVLPHFRMDYRH